MTVYEKSLVNEGHRIRFAVDDRREAGWDVVEEQDRRVVRWARYDDWHRVERRLEAFGRQVAALKEQGWLDGVS